MSNEKWQLFSSMVITSKFCLLDVTTGQRKYGGPPPNYEGVPPGNGCEVSSLCGEKNYVIF